MSIYALKPKFQNLLRPLVRQLAAKGVTANQVTLIACLLSILLGVVLALFPTFSSLFFLIPIWFFLRMALNAIDGMLAREFNQKSRLGGYLNEITDVVSDAALYFPFAFVALAVALHLKMRLWVATSLIAIVIIYSVLYCQYGVYLPLLSSVLACLLFLIPGVQLYIHYKKQQNV